MKKKSAATYKSLRARCKESLAKWQYREVFRICSTQNRPPNGDDLVKMASDLCDRLRAFRVEASEAEARQMIEKHLHGYVVRAEQELTSRNKLIAPEFAETDIEETERIHWVRSFPDPVGKGEALIKAYKRRFGVTRIQAVEG